MVDRESVRYFLQDSSDDALASWHDPVEKLAVTGSGLDYKIKVDDKGGVSCICKTDNKLEFVSALISLIGCVGYELVLGVSSDSCNCDERLGCIIRSIDD